MMTSSVFSRALLIAGALGLCLCALHAQNGMADAREALARGDASALRHATSALREQPLGALENVQVALTLFWMGQFDDAPRYLRRALAADPGVLQDVGRLADLMPRADARARLNQLAPLIQDNADLCFLAAVVLLLDDDRNRALPLLVRAAQLAATDVQAERLADRTSPPRNESRGRVALRNGDFRDAMRAFAFAAADEPAVPEHLAGVALALAGLGDTEQAAEMFNAALDGGPGARLAEWLHLLEVDREQIGTAGLAVFRGDARDAPVMRLGAALLFASGLYSAAREACVETMAEHRLDAFPHELLRYMEERDLRGGPPLRPSPLQPDAPPEPGDEPPQEPPTPAPESTLEGVQRDIRRGDYDRAREAIDGLVDDDSPPEVMHLLFVVLVGTNELDSASLALQAWFRSVTRTERVRLNAVREYFATGAQFEEWRARIIEARDADPNAGTPRLINTYVLLSQGQYNEARDELVVARIAEPANATVLALDRILSDPEFRGDAAPNGVRDDPTPRALMGHALQALRDGRFADARNYLLRAAEADPELPLVREYLLQAYFALGDLDNAVRTVRELLTVLEDTRVQPRGFRAFATSDYFRSPEFRDHLAVLRAACEERPLSAGLFLLLGVLEHDRGNLAEAAEAMQRWHDNEPGRRADGPMRLYEDIRKRVE
jgi:tetratricopeptide (TPR) repeat protein